jgi:hypothetical protein
MNATLKKKGGITGLTKANLQDFKSCGVASEHGEFASDDGDFDDELGQPPVSATLEEI